VAAVGPGKAKVALKINTGMNRFGLTLDEFYSLAQASPSFAGLALDALFSHLACADDPSHDMNFQQLKHFKQALQLAKSVFPDIKGSLANSAGILLGPDWHFDLVRPGIGLYGGQCQKQPCPELNVTASLHLPVVQVRDLSTGDSVGYGGDFVAQAPMKVALVKGGYADGVPRSLSNRGRGWFHSDLPLLGRVSMDSCVFDISHLPPTRAPQAGDFIEIFGEHIAVDQVAGLANTISYEIFTGLGERLHRHYDFDRKVKVVP
jgi:alanine racemase